MTDRIDQLLQDLQTRQLAEAAARDFTKHLGEPVSARVAVLAQRVVQATRKGQLPRFRGKFPTLAGSMPVIIKVCRLAEQVSQAGDTERDQALVTWAHAVVNGHSKGHVPAVELRYAHTFALQLSDDLKGRDVEYIAKALHGGTCALVERASAKKRPKWREGRAKGRKPT